MIATSVAVALAGAAADAAADDVRFSQDFNRCIAEANRSGLGLERCVRAELDVQQQRLAQTLAAIARRIGPKDRERLVRGHEAWLRQSHEYCSLFADLEPAPTPDAAYVDCAMTWAASRVDEVREELARVAESTAAPTARAR